METAWRAPAFQHVIFTCMSPIDMTRSTDGEDVSFRSSLALYILRLYRHTCQETCGWLLRWIACPVSTYSKHGAGARVEQGSRGLFSDSCYQIPATWDPILVPVLKDRNVDVGCFCTASTGVFCCCCAVTVSFDTLFGHTSAFALRSFLRHRGGVLQTRS